MGGFDNLFNPDNEGTLTGFLGRAAGVPTGGDLQSAAMKKLGELRSQGMDPQRAMVQFVQTPEGQAWMTRSSAQDITNTAASFLKATQAPTPTLHNAGDGRTVLQMDQSGKVKTVFTAPDPDVERMRQYQAIAQLPDDKLKEIATMAMMPPEQRVTRTEIAINDMVRNNQITPELGAKLKAGVLELKPVKGGADGNLDMGYVVIDKSNPTASQFIPLPTPGGGSAAQTPLRPGAKVNQDGSPVTAGAQPTPGQPQAPVRPAASMFLGAGPVSGAIRAGADIAGTVLGGKAGEAVGGETVRQQGDIDTLRTAITELAGMTPGKEMKATTNSWLNLIPGYGMFDNNPGIALDNGIKLREQVEAQLKHFQGVVEDPVRYTKAARDDASKMVSALTNVEQFIPTREDMLAEKSRVTSGKTPTGALDKGTAAATGAKKVVEGAVAQPSGGAQAGDAAIIQRIPTMSQQEVYDLLKSGTASPAVKRALVPYLRSKVQPTVQTTTPKE